MVRGVVARASGRGEDVAPKRVTLRIRRWHLSLVAVLLVVAQVCSIPRLPGVPLAAVLSPTYGLSWLLLVLTGLRHPRQVRRLLVRPAVAIVLMLYLVLSVGDVYIGLTESQVWTAALLGNAMACSVLVGLAAFASADPPNARLIAVTLIVTVVLSHLWLLAELYVGEPFMSIRHELYAEPYARGALQDIPPPLATGLTPWVHLLGYQTVFAVAGLLAYCLSGRRREVRALCQLLLGPVTIAALASSQRSAVLASVLSSLVILGSQHRRSRLLRIVPAAVVGVALMGMVIGEGYIAKGDQPWVSEKLTSDRSSLEGTFRLLLQLRALSMVVQYPLGTVYSGVSWEEQGFWYVASNTESGSPYEAGRTIAVHNAYLGDAVRYGVVVLLGCLALLGVVTAECLRLLRSQRDFGSGAALFQAIPAATLGLFLVQSMLHNPGILTGEPMSLILLALLAGLAEHRRQGGTINL